MNKTILVTGASGFLGTNILRAFESQDKIEVVAACRDKNRLPEFFNGEVREGDLRDPGYRRAVVKDIDVICHAGTWASMWGNAKKEQEYFYLPTIDLIEQAIDAGVKRFLMTSTVAMAKVRKDGSVIDDFSQSAYTGFWQHLDRLIDIDAYMQANASRGMQMVTMRLGHFVGAGNKLGLVPALVPRLRTYMVPWLATGTSRMPLVADSDLGRSFVAAALAEQLQDYESFNICGASFPTSREVIEYIAEQTGVPVPFFSVPYPAGYAFAWLMEKLFPFLPGKAPFLTRSIVHLAEDWQCSTSYANKKLGYIPQKDWKIAMNEALEEIKAKNYAWPHLAQN
jgi:nucleoside-diphosphate-sugar epimerase